MPRLRSRKIMPKPEVKSEAFEPETPVKTGEGLCQRSIVTPLGSSHSPKSEDALVYESGIVRRSPRLASKSSVGLDVAAVEVNVSNRKRKCVNTGDDEDCIDFVLESTEGNGCTSGGKGSLVVDAGKDVGMSQAHEDVGGDGSSARSGALGQTGERLLNSNKGGRKRDLGTEVDPFELEHPVQSSTENKLLTLRSGKRIEAAGALCSGNGIEATWVKSKSRQRSKIGGIKLENTFFNETGRESNGWTWNAVAIDADSKQTEDKVSVDEKGNKEVAMNVSLNSALTSTKSYQETERADGSTKRIDKGKEELVFDEEVVDTKDASMISTFAIPGKDNKGKGKLSIDDVTENWAGTSTGSTVSTSQILSGNSDDPKPITGSSTAQNRVYRERFRDIAKRNASRFAHFSSLEEEGNDIADGSEGEPPVVVNNETEDWPGPFSTAKRIIKDRQEKASMQQSLLKNNSTPIVWNPKKTIKSNINKNSVPSLVDICLCSIAENANAISSLDYVPDVLRHRLSDKLCDSRKMDEHFLGLLVHGTPTEIHVRECSWITEDIFTKTFTECDMSNLTVLQLDQCGASLPDYILSSTLAHSPKCLPTLTSLSLVGAYRLSDAGLSLLAASAPALRSINLSQCSLITSDAIHCLASSVGSVLMELYIDECQGIDAMIILPALILFLNLEVLSLTNIANVSDNFLSKYVPVRGHNMKELVLRNCANLTDSSMRMIAEYCPKLCAIDLSNLSKLTDSALEYLANSCLSIHTLKFCRNGFSDEAVAAYIENCGEPLRELLLSNVSEVGHNTATSLAAHSKNLHSLDLSWCRKLTDEAFGLIVDSCTNLKKLKVFGCTQITNAFLDGHSNPEVQIIGLKMVPLLGHLTHPEYLRGPLRHSFVAST